MENDQAKAELLTGLAEIYQGFSFSKASMSIYLAALRALSLEDLRGVLNRGVMANTWKFMPKPGDILELARPNTKILADDEWNLLVDHARKAGRESPPCGSDATMKALRAAGGYQALCNSTDDELHWMKKRFDESFQVIIQENVLQLEAADASDRTELGEGDQQSDLDQLTTGIGNWGPSVADLER